MADPRAVGGRYFSAYWQLEYQVLAVARVHPSLGSWVYRVRWADGVVTEHGTTWAPGDRVIS